MGRFSGWDLAFWTVVVAIIFSMVRPGSKAGGAMIAITEALAALTGEATGYYSRGG